MQNPGITWLVTFGMIGYWVLMPLIDLLRTPKTSADNSRSSTRTAH